MDKCIDCNNCVVPEGMTASDAECRRSESIDLVTGETIAYESPNLCRVERTFINGCGRYCSECGLYFTPKV